jgi:hypothetical protein
MAETCVVNTEMNGYRNVVLRLTYVSADGSGITNQKVYDASSAGAYGVVRAGQTFYPGVHTTVIGLDYDVQDTKIQVQWEATANADIFPLGNAPEDFDWTRIGGLRVPATLTGATGSILVSTLDQVPGATFFVLLYLRKNVPVT